MTLVYASVFFLDLDPQSLVDTPNFAVIWFRYSWEVRFVKRQKCSSTNIDEEWSLIATLLSSVEAYLNHAYWKLALKFLHL